jgi:S-adenosyl methyltransferase
VTDDWDWQQDETRREKASQIDATVPNFARVGDYLRGGRSNFEIDRKAAHALIAAAPVLGTIGPAVVAFHQRVVRYLAAEAGVRQFLDIGTGLALSGNTHQIAQSIDPCCRVVYVDNDPMVLSHARALMKSAPAGATGVVDADVQESDAIVAGAAQTLDLGQPVAVMLMSTLAFVEDTAAVVAAVADLAGAVPSGSYVAIYHVASDLDPAVPLAARQVSQWPSLRITPRSRAEVASLVAGLEPVPPGLVPICDWRPALDDPRFGDVVPYYGVVARKP